MTDLPRISVVLPNYNHAHCLGAALESACMQEPPPHEVLVFDDCSTDHSMEVIQSFARRFTFVRYRRYPAKSADWQKAWFDHVHLASGDWILALSADDRIYPGYISAVGAMAARYPHCGAVFTDAHVVTPQGDTIGFRRCGVAQPCFLQGEMLHRQLRGLNVSECGNGTIIRKDLVLWLGSNQVGQMGPWCDAVGYAVAALKDGACYVPEVLGTVCVDDQQPTWSQSFVEDADKAIEAFQNVTAFLEIPEIASVAPPGIAMALETKLIMALPAQTKKALLMQPGRLARTERFFREILDENPHDADAHASWGIVQGLMGRMADAEPALRRAVELNPNIVWAWNSLGECLQARGNLVDAVNAFRQATELDTSFTAAFINLGNLLFALGHYTQALTAQQHVVQLNPHSSSAYTSLGNTLLAMERWEETVAALQQAVENDPNPGSARGVLNQILHQLGRPLPKVQTGHEPALQRSHAN